MQSLLYFQVETYTPPGEYCTKKSINGEENNGCKMALLRKFLLKRLLSKILASRS